MNETTQNRAESTFAEKFRRRPLARKVTLRMAIILVAAFALIFVGAFHTVQRIITDKNREFARSVLGIYTDLVAYYTGLNDVPITPENNQMIQFCGDYICQWYGIDYAYMYVPDVENDTLTYIALSRNEENTPETDTGNIAGIKIDYKLLPDELAVWNGEVPIVYGIDNENSYGHEFSSIMLVGDGYGNRVIAGIDISYDDTIAEIVRSFLILAAVIVAALAGIILAVYFIVKTQVSRPAQTISRGMTDFITDGKHSGTRINENGCREFSMISAAFNSMAQDIDDYLDSIEAMTSDREHQRAELDIASRIQQGFLPKKPLITDSYELRGTMIPARDVGGDLFDYTPLEDGRVLTVVADVSGKGVSAAIFMGVTLALIRQYASFGYSPAEILGGVNAALAPNNPELLFATAFVGIYDNRDKSFTYANAGHNRPYTVGADGVRELASAVGTPLGLFDGETYSEDVIRLHAGDTLFLYTDGVTEAINGERRFYGVERLEDTLREFRLSHGEDPVAYVLGSVRRFADGFEQYDDITMLTLKPKDNAEMLLDPDIREMERIKQAILALPLPRQKQLNLCLAAEECFVNICSYAYEGGVPEGEKVRFTLNLSDRVEMRFEDGGIPFDPSKDVMTSPDDYDIDTQIGGLGRYIAFSGVDDVRYEYINGRNVLTLIKFSEEENK